MSILERLKFSTAQSVQDFQKEEINPKDLQGKRLSKFWEKGDTVLSVTLKKTKNFFFNLINPNTYSRNTILGINYERIKHQNYLIIFFLVIVPPLLVYFPLILIKIRNIKNIYYLNKIAKRQFIERKFNLKNKRISLIDIGEDMKKNKFE